MNGCFRQPLARQPRSLRAPAEGGGNRAAPAGITTLYPWRLQMTEEPVPVPVAFRAQYAVVLPMRSTVPLLDSMLAKGESVGPVLLCCVFERFYIPVEIGRGNPLAKLFHVTNSLECRHDPLSLGYGRCWRMWMLPPNDTGTLTDPAALHSALVGMRKVISRTGPPA